MEYFDLLFDNPGAALYLISLLVFIAGIVFIIIVLRKQRSSKGAKPAVKTAVAAITPAGITEVPTSPDAVPKPKIILGTGTVRCIAIRNPVLMGYAADENILDFTTMPEPLGELHIADTTCPVSGGVYTVREKEDGTLEDYDPRQVPMDVETTPERAYQATHWPELLGVWQTPVVFYKNMSFWFAIGALVVMFFLAATAMGA